MTILSPRPDAEQDRQVVLRHLGGDSEAFAALARQHVPSLLASAQRRLSSASEAEDAVQDALERALKSIRQLADEDREECNLGGWLHRIVINVCNDRLQRRYADALLPYRLPLPVRVPAPEEQAGDPVARRMIRQALEDLPAAQRQAFLLHEVVGLSYPDLAAETGVSEDNARARVHRARRTLRRRLLNLRAAGAGAIALPAALTRYRHFPSVRRPVVAVGNSIRRLAWEGASTVPGVANTANTTGIGATLSRGGAVAATMAAGFATVAGGLTIAGGSLQHHAPTGVAVQSLGFGRSTTAPAALGAGAAVGQRSVVAAGPTDTAVAPTNESTTTTTTTTLGGVSTSTSATNSNSNSTATTQARTPDSTTTTSISPTSTTVESSATTEPSWVPDPSTWVSSAGQTPSPASPTQSAADCSSLADTPGGGTIPPANPDGTQLAIQWVSNLAPVTMAAHASMLTFSEDTVLQPTTGSDSDQSAHVLAGVCTDPTNQVVVADLTVDGQTSQPVQLQGRAVASTGGDGVWGTLYRGTVSFPDGAPSGVALPTEFLADLACSIDSNQCALVVAFATISYDNQSTTTSTTSTTTTPDTQPVQTATTTTSSG